MTLDNVMDSLMLTSIPHSLLGNNNIHRSKIILIFLTLGGTIKKCLVKLEIIEAI